MSLPLFQTLAPNFPRHLLSSTTGHQNVRLDHAITVKLEKEEVIVWRTAANFKLKHGHAPQEWNLEGEKSNAFGPEKTYYKTVEGSNDCIRQTTSETYTVTMTTNYDNSKVQFLGGAQQNQSFATRSKKLTHDMEPKSSISAAKVKEGLPKPDAAASAAAEAVSVAGTAIEVDPDDDGASMFSTPQAKGFKSTASPAHAIRSQEQILIDDSTVLVAELEELVKSMRHENWRLVLTNAILNQWDRKISDMLGRAKVIQNSNAQLAMAASKRLFVTLRKIITLYEEYTKAKRKTQDKLDKLASVFYDAQDILALRYNIAAVIVDAVLVGVVGKHIRERNIAEACKSLCLTNLRARFHVLQEASNLNIKLVSTVIQAQGALSPAVGSNDDHVARHMGELMAALVSVEVDPVIMTSTENLRKLCCVINHDGETTLVSVLRVFEQDTKDDRDEIVKAFYLCESMVAVMNFARSTNIARGKENNESTRQSAASAVIDAIVAEFKDSKLESEPWTIVATHKDVFAKLAVDVCASNTALATQFSGNQQKKAFADILVNLEKSLLKTWSKAIHTTICKVIDGGNDVELEAAQEVSNHFKVSMETLSQPVVQNVRLSHITKPPMEISELVQWANNVVGFLNQLCEFNACVDDRQSLLCTQELYAERMTQSATSNYTMFIKSLVALSHSFAFLASKPRTDAQTLAFENVKKATSKRLNELVQKIEVRCFGALDFMIERTQKRFNDALPDVQGGMLASMEKGFDVTTTFLPPSHVLLLGKNAELSKTIAGRSMEAGEDCPEKLLRALYILTNKPDMLHTVKVRWAVAEARCKMIRITLDLKSSWRATPDDGQETAIALYANGIIDNIIDPAVTQLQKCVDTCKKHNQNLSSEAVLLDLFAWTGGEILKPAYSLASKVCESLLITSNQYVPLMWESYIIQRNGSKIIDEMITKTFAEQFTPLCALITKLGVRLFTTSKAVHERKADCIPKETMNHISGLCSRAQSAEIYAAAVLGCTYILRKWPAEQASRNVKAGQQTAFLILIQPN